MKRWLLILLVIAVFAVGWYYFFYQRTATRRAATQTVETSAPDQSALKPASINWQPVDSAQNGFTLDMPAGQRELQVPAYNELGTSQPVEMLLASPDPSTSFAVTWADNPPVARVNGNNPYLTLEAAREGMLARTKTYAMTQTDLKVAGFPATDVLARNDQGGVLDARLIYAGARLYALIATFPSMTARREEDVDRFYNSFTPRLTGAEGKTGNGGNS